MEHDCKMPFIRSTQDMLETMLGISSHVNQNGSPLTEPIITSTVQLQGERPGGIRLMFPFDTAKRVVAEMLGRTIDEMDDETLIDGVGEMANIVAGNVKATLSEMAYSFSLTLPQVASIQEAAPVDKTFETSRLSTALGDFDLIFWLATSKS